MSTASQSCPSERRARWAAEALLVLSGLDGAMTLGSVGLGRAYEANPAMASLYSLHPLAFLLGKTCLMAACCAVLCRAAASRPRAALATGLLGCLIYATVVGWNLFVLAEG